ncbi:hypothetical protein ACHAWF_015048 [Thalassiosira exigua]
MKTNNRTLLSRDPTESSSIFEVPTNRSLSCITPVVLNRNEVLAQRVDVGMDTSNEFDRSGRIPTGHLGVHEVLIEEVDVLGAMGASIDLAVRTNKVVMKAVPGRQDVFCSRYADARILDFHEEFQVGDSNVFHIVMRIPERIVMKVHSKEVVDLFHERFYDATPTWVLNERGNEAQSKLVVFVANISECVGAAKLVLLLGHISKIYVGAIE